MSYRRIKYPSGRITPAVLGINVIDSPPNTINMVGILSDVFAADKETTGGGYYDDKYVETKLDGSTLELNPTSEHRHTSDNSI